MAKAKARKKVPQIKTRRKAQIETDDYSFWIEYKSAKKSTLLPIFSEMSKFGDLGNLKEDDIPVDAAVNIVPKMVEAMTECITDWEIDAPINSESMNELPLDVQVQMVSVVMSGGAQEKNS